MKKNHLKREKRSTYQSELKKKSTQIIPLKFNPISPKYFAVEKCADGEVVTVLRSSVLMAA
jgi:hypothetical protein